ncbi:beta strand repeat-containing protein [Verrucomicrobiota bacterium]
MMRITCATRVYVFCLLCSIPFTWLPVPAQGAPRTWSGAGGGDDWNTGGNWGGTPPTPGGGDNVVFNATDSGGINVLDQDYTITGMSYTGGGVHETDLNGKALQVDGDVAIGNGNDSDATVTWSGGGTNTIGDPASLRAVYVGRHPVNANNTSAGDLTISGGTIIDAFVSEFKVGEKLTYGHGIGNGLLTLGSGSILTIGTDGSTAATMSIGADLQSYGAASVSAIGTLDASAGVLDLNLGVLNLGYRSTTGGAVSGDLVAGTNSQIDAGTIRIGYVGGINTYTAVGSMTLLDSSRLAADHLYMGWYDRATGTLTIGPNGDVTVNDTVVIGKTRNVTGIVTAGVDSVVMLGTVADPLATFDVGRHTVNVNGTIARGTIDLSKCSTSQVVAADASTVRIGVKDTVTSAHGAGNGTVNLGGVSSFKVGTAGNNTANMYVGANWNTTEPADNTIGLLHVPNGDVDLHLADLYVGYKDDRGGNNSGSMNLGSNSVIDATTIRLGYNRAGGGTKTTTGTMTLSGTAEMTATSISIGRHRKTNGTLTIETNGNFTVEADTFVVGDIVDCTGLVTGRADSVVRIGTDASPVTTLRVGRHTVNESNTSRGALALGQCATSQVVVADGGTVSIGTKDTFLVSNGAGNGTVALGGVSSLKVGTAGNNTANMYIGATWNDYDTGYNTVGALAVLNGGVDLHLADLYVGYKNGRSGDNSGTLTVGAGGNNVIDATTIRLGYSANNASGNTLAGTMSLSGTTEMNVGTLTIGQQRNSTGTLTIEPDGVVTALIDTLLIGEVYITTGKIEVEAGGYLQLGTDADPITTLRLGHHTINVAGTTAAGTIDMSAASGGGIVIADGGALTVGLKYNAALANGTGNGTITLGPASLKVGTTGNRTATIDIGYVYNTYSGAASYGTINGSNAVVELNAAALNVGYRSGSTPTAQGTLRMGPGSSGAVTKVQVGYNGATGMLSTKGTLTIGDGTAANGIQLYANGDMDTIVDGQPAGLDLTTDAYLTIDSPAVLDLDFKDPDPDVSGFYWGLRASGNRTNEIQTRIDAGRITVTTGDLDPSYSISNFYASAEGYTYVGCYVAGSSGQGTVFRIQ